MQAIIKRHQILECLDNLTTAETEQVLAYVKSLQAKHVSINPSSKLKREAMMQIQQALKKDRLSNTYF